MSESFKDEPGEMIRVHVIEGGYVGFHRSLWHGSHRQHVLDEIAQKIDERYEAMPIVPAYTRHLFSYDFLKRLQVAGLIGTGVLRVVIDCKHDEYAVMYLQHAVNEKVLDVFIDTLVQDGTRLAVKVVDGPPPDDIPS